MKLNAKSKTRARVGAKIIRKDGTVENLGIIADSGDSIFMKWLRSLKIHFINMLGGLRKWQRRS